jgi:hypothetical protein
MKTFHFISSLDTTIVLTDKKEFQGSQTTVKKTAYHKINLIDRVTKVENELLRVASIERKKEKKQSFFNKHKKQ